MADLKKELSSLKDPLVIKKANFASSPYVLRKVFKADPVIRRLVAAWEKVIPLIEDEIRLDGAAKAIKLSDETKLSAYAFIIENVDPQAAPRILGGLFRMALKKPGPFFVHFAAHVIRIAYRKPVKPLEPVYSRAELSETERMLQ